jgi:predicted DNA-binding protein (MmcQ/YjbR family)
MLSSVELQCLQVFINELNLIKSQIEDDPHLNKRGWQELYATKSYLEKRIATIQSHRITGE